MLNIYLIFICLHSVFNPHVGPEQTQREQMVTTYGVHKNTETLSLTYNNVHNMYNMYSTCTLKL